MGALLFCKSFLFFSCICEKYVFSLCSQDTNTMSLDIIYLIIATPVTIAVMYGSHVIKRNRKRRIETPEATPYQFERDEFIPEFNEFTQMLLQRRMYKGRGDK